MNSLQDGIDLVGRNDFSHNSLLSIKKFVELNAEKIKFCDKKKIILVVGNTGAGKTTLVSLLTKANMECIETYTGSAQFMIADEKHLISGMSTTTAETIIPNLMVHEETDTIFYDCSGFNDTRGVANDISVSYFNRILIEKASAIKFVFTVSFQSVQNGAGDRRDFMSLAKHITTFIKDTCKYETGIALIITKVENRYVKKNGKLELVDDKTIIQSVAVFLTQLKTDLKWKCDNIESTDCFHEKELNEKIIKLIDILLLKKRENQYERIGILRLANQVGPVKDIKILQDERRTIQKIINKDLSYVPKDDGDFGFTVSDETKYRIHEILEEMQFFLLDDVERIGAEFEEFYLRKEESIIDIRQLENMMSTAYEKISELSGYNQLELFEEKIGKFAADLEINLSIASKYQFKSNINLAKFLQSVSNSGLSSTFHISNGLQKFKDFLKKSRVWYHFLIIFHDKLSEYQVQRNIQEYRPCKDKLIRQCSIKKHERLNCEEIDLKRLAENVDCRVYYTIENIQLNYYELNMLKLVLNQTLDSTLTTKLMGNKLTVNGYNVKMSDIGPLSAEAINHVEIFALNNLFIDVDIDKTGHNARLSFIAPKWHIIGDRQIILKGEDRKPHSEAQAPNGEDGLPGLPGGAAGNFLGIGQKSFNDQHFKIQLDGGNGGPGQCGGRGADGIKGETPPIPGFLMVNPWNSYTHKRKTLFNWGIFGKINYKVQGRNGAHPSAGGNGGCGGIGGNVGNILINVFKVRPNFIILKNKGINGPIGSGGIGGSAAPDGDEVEADYFQILYFFEFSTSKWNTTSKANGIAGKNGLDGGNREGLEHPAASKSFENISSILSDYIDFVNASKRNTIQESFLDEFLKDLDVDSISAKPKKSIGSALIDRLSSLSIQ